MWKIFIQDFDDIAMTFALVSNDWREIEIFRSHRVSRGVDFPVGISTHAVTAPTFRPEQVSFINPRSRQSCEFDKPHRQLSLVDNFFSKYIIPSRVMTNARITCFISNFFFA